MNPTKKFQETIMKSMAKFYSQQLSENIKRGLALKKKTAKFTNKTLKAM